MKRAMSLAANIL